MVERTLENIPRFSWAEIKAHVARRASFEAMSPMGTALIRVERYEPVIGLAPHAGHNVREELQSKMAMEEAERRAEEDPGTASFVSSFPIRMVGLDSRYEYDVDRGREEAVYVKPFQSWGKKVWKTPPSKDELSISSQKWDEFHELLEYLVGQFVEMFGAVCLLEIHAYNPARPAYVGKKQNLPLFHLATSETDRKQHGPAIDAIAETLSAVSLAGIPTAVRQDALFRKDGALATRLAPAFPYSLFLPIHVKSAYFDAEAGALNPDAAGRVADAFASIARDLLSRFFKAPK